MAMGGHGNIGFFEDFKGVHAATLSDATQYRYNDIALIAQSGDVAMSATVDEANGVVSFSGAAGAADGIVLTSAPMQPSVCGEMSMEVRFKLSALTSWRAFVGWAETVLLTEAVEPFTLSVVTLTANNTGNTFGAYYDTTATTDDWRAMASLAGVAQTSAQSKEGVALGTLGTRFGAVPVLDSYMYMRVELHPDGSGDIYYGDVSIDPGNTGPKRVASIKKGTLSTTALYHPIVQLIDPGTADPTWEVDFFGGNAFRDWAY